MFLSKRVVIIFSFLLSFGPSAWSQILPTPPTVYVSGGSSIYSVTVVSGTTVVTQLLNRTGSNFESLAIGPDNADTIAPANGLAAGNALHPVLLYACDTAGKTVIRFDPANTATQLVYSSGAITPVCGRSTSTGDFYVTDKVGGGVFKLSGSNGAALANVPFTGAAIGASALPVSAGSPAAPRAITQKYVGDPLVVDNAGNKVLRASFGGLATNSLSFSTFIQNSTLLSGLAGIARTSTGEVFVSNGVLKVGQTSFPPVAHFKGDATLASSCSVLNFSKSTNEVPAYLAALPVADSTQTKVTDTVYLVTSANSKGTLWSWNTASAGTGNCSLTPVASIQNVLSGVAVAPAPVTLIKEVTSSMTNPTATTFNFNSHLFQLTATGGCMANVTSYPVVPATVNAMISLSGTGMNGLPHGATPVPNLGEQGYEIVYVAHWLSPAVSPACTTVFSDGAFEEGIYGFYDSNLYNNSRIVWCDNGDPNTFTQANEPQLRSDTVLNVSGPTTCGASQTVGVYPVGGPIPGDQGTITRNSFYAVVNAGLNAQPAQFCGFQSPLTNTTDPNEAPTPTGNTINVKFKLATASGSCQNGPYISDASALISVAQIKDSTGATVFNAIRVNATANSLDLPPLFNAGNNQYSFSLNIGSLASGTYSLTVSFLTDNQFNQTTYFKH